jgi:hypothetical protein
MSKSKKVEQIHGALRKLEQKANVAGHVVLDKDGKHIGTVRLSYPRDGAGQLKALAANWLAVRPVNPETGLADFQNWTPWQYGWANGGGYDKATAALSGMTIGTVTIKDDGFNWYNQLRDAGYAVIQAI